MPRRLLLQAPARRYAILHPRRVGRRTSDCICRNVPKLRSRTVHDRVILLGRRGRQYRREAWGTSGKGCSWRDATTGTPTEFCYKIHMANSTGCWVVYEVRGVEFVHLSKRFKTKQEAEKERERLAAGRKRRKQKHLGVGFVRS